jgi:hypothetical protein
VLSRLALGVLALLLPAVSTAQEVPQGSTVPPVYTPPTPQDRVNWVLEGTISLPVVIFNAGDSAVSTYKNWPKEWGRGVSGFSKRIADEEAYSAVSGGLEAGIGSIWGEDPRYRRAIHGGVFHRIGHTIVATFVAPRPDGHIAPAWGRFAAEGGAIEIENIWLPPSARTSSAMAWRVGEDFAFRAVSNVWDEFWPDLRKRLPARLR